MTIVGTILLIVGAIMSAAFFTGWAPDAVANWPVQLKGWLAVTAVGFVLIVLNKRPGN